MLKTDTPAKLRAIVIGAGFAGEGHTHALQHWGVEVAAVCGRQPEIVRTVADRLGVGIASTDWRATLQEVRPDIVAIATPAALRREVIEAAVAMGCHLYCDKPLATTAADAADFYRLVEKAGVKHAYAATRCYDPSVVWLSELIREGIVGRIQGIQFSLPVYLAPVLPWYWALDLKQGGGLLNNHFSHLLSILERVLDAPLVGVEGRANFAIDRAPVIPGIHDFRDWGAKADLEVPEDAEWRSCDADTSYKARMRFATPTGEVFVRLESEPDAVASDNETGMRIHGETGVLFARGTGSFRVSHFPNGTPPETELPVPERLLAALPHLDGNCEDRWAALAKDFVADIRAEPHQPYLTFRDGWRYQEAIEAIRSGRGWYELPG